MTTWNPLTDTETGHKKPVVMGLFRRLRDMVLSVIEGDPTAPKIENKAIQSYKSIFAMPTSGASLVLGPWGTGYSTVFIDTSQMKSAVAGGLTAFDLFVSLSSDGGATWAAETNITTPNVAAGLRAVFPTRFYIGTRDGFLWSDISDGYTPGAAAIALPVGTANAIRFRTTGLNFQSGAADRGVFMGLCT